MLFSPEGEEEYLPSTRVQHPAESERPADGGVAAQAPPAQHQVRGEGLAGREDGEEDQDSSDEVMEGLEGEDLGEDAEGGEVLEGAGAGRTAVAWWHVEIEVVVRVYDRDSEKEENAGSRLSREHLDELLKGKDCTGGQVEGYPWVFLYTCTLLLHGSKYKDQDQEEEKKGGDSLWSLKLLKGIKKIHLGENYRNFVDR